MFLKQQIRILEGFLKDHVALKTEVMMLCYNTCAMKHNISQY